MEREGERRTQEGETDERLHDERAAARGALARERQDRDRIEKALRREKATNGPSDAPFRHQKRELEVEDSRIERRRAEEDKHRDDAEASTDDGLSAERAGEEREPSRED